MYLQIHFTILLTNKNFVIKFQSLFLQSEKQIERFILNGSSYTLKAEVASLHGVGSGVRPNNFYINTVL